MRDHRRRLHCVEYDDARTGLCLHKADQLAAVLHQNTIDQSEEDKRAPGWRKAFVGSRFVGAEIRWPATESAYPTGSSTGERRQSAGGLCSGNRQSRVS